ncbi:MAG: SDR family oxidoreductase [SAR202 cluster bacterium]|nr:SDR family oxidoreductase [SAR202 cluster bacterium]|tara:strand:- start:1222 stop:1977 length:756 start_codon:yes stop_codon:yes gene_type:complete
MRLNNKIALMTGIGQGMGRATAKLFAQEGAKVILTARTEEKLQETATQIQNLGGTSIVVPADVSAREEAKSVISKIIEEFGRLDIIYSAAGGNFDPSRKLQDVDEKFFDQTISNTVNSLYNLVHEARPIMKNQGGGSIVSVAASFGVRQEGNSAYGAAKSAVIGLTKNLARELHEENIRVNSIAAGLFRGSIGEGKVLPAEPTLLRIGYPQDIAYCSLFLASDESSWITGQNIAVDGGVDVGARDIWKYER